MEEKGYIEDGTVASEPMGSRRTSYADVMTYLHTIRLSPEDKRRVAHRLAVEVDGPALAKTFERIDELSMLSAGWAGEDSMALDPYVISNIRRVLLISDNNDWENWAISPNLNATLNFQSLKTDAVISLGIKEFSYYGVMDGKEYGESHLDFSPESFLRIIRQFG